MVRASASASRLLLPCLQSCWPAALQMCSLLTASDQLLAAGMATDGWWRSFKLRNNVDHHSTFTVGCA